MFNKLQVDDRLKLQESMSKIVYTPCKIIIEEYYLIYLYNIGIYFNELIFLQVLEYRETLFEKYRKVTFFQALDIAKYPLGKVTR